MNIPWPLWEVAEKFAPLAGYSKTVDLFIWSAFYAIAVGKAHPVTAPIAGAPPEVQDEFIADLVAAFEAGKTKGSYFEALLEDVIEKFKLPVGPDVVKAIVADTVRNRPRKKG